MSKKAQPQNKEVPKNKLQIVQEQNEPFLKVLQKKVRNINKKLLQIAELEIKDNLKPEQIEKVGRKNTLIEERAKLEEFASLYKQTYIENAAYYRNLVLKELQTVAKGIAAYHSEHPSDDKHKLAQLWGSLQSQTFSTLNDGIAAIGNSLKEFVNDRKLQKSLNNFVEKYGHVRGDVVNQQKIVNEICEEKKEEVKVEEKKEEKVEKAAEKVEEVKVAVVEEKQPQIVEPPKQAQVKVEESKNETPITETAKVEQTATEEKEERKDYRNGGKPYYGRGGYRGNKDNREKKAYKPKYEEKEGEKREERKEEKRRSSSSDSSPQARNFRRDEIRKLEDEGFTVVGKPKPKAKNQKEMRDFHDQQHGKKHHHHGHPSHV